MPSWVALPVIAHENCIRIFEGEEVTQSTRNSVDASSSSPKLQFKLPPPTTTRENVDTPPHPSVLKKQGTVGTRERENSAKCAALADIQKTDTFGHYHRRISTRRGTQKKGNIQRVLDIRGSKSLPRLMKKRKTTVVKKIRKGFKQGAMTGERWRAAKGSKAFDKRA